jgi:cytochrome P450
MAVHSQQTTTIPTHVPPELVKEIPMVRGTTTTARPHEEIQAINHGPDVFYATNAPNGGQAWILRRIEHCRQVYMDTEHFSNANYAPFPKLTGGDWRMVPIDFDPPVHTRYRMILNPLLGPKAIAALDQKMVEDAREYITAFKDRGHCDFMREFAYEFPIRIFLELMDLPREKTAEFLKWERGMLYGANMEEVQASTQSVVDYLRAEIAARRENPGDDFIGHALRAEVEGRRLDDNELLGFCFTLFIGGLDTVVVHLGHMFRYLAENPEQQALLRGDPSLIPNAVEEMMRAFGSAGGNRTCVKETTIGGVTIKPGDKVMMYTGLASRDPDEFAGPNELRFDRRPRHISFGYGPHLCIGVHLARREMHIAIRTMLEMLPPFSLEPGAEIVSEMFGLYQVRALPLVWAV